MAVGETGDRLYGFDPLSAMVHSRGEPHLVYLNNRRVFVPVVRESRKCINPARHAVLGFLSDGQSTLRHFVQESLP